MRGAWPPGSIPEHTGQVSLVPAQASPRGTPLCARAHARPAQSRETARPKDSVVRSARSSSRDRDIRGRATAFPSVSRTGSAAAAQESGHHGCLYYPPSNSNFFPSLLANYPASVLISFYYWN